MWICSTRLRRQFKAKKRTATVWEETNAAYMYAKLVQLRNCTLHSREISRMNRTIGFSLNPQVLSWQHFLWIYLHLKFKETKKRARAHTGEPKRNENRRSSTQSKKSSAKIRRVHPKRLHIQCLVYFISFVSAGYEQIHAWIQSSSSKPDLMSPLNKLDNW